MGPLVAAPKVLLWGVVVGIASDDDVEVEIISGGWVLAKFINLTIIRPVIETTLGGDDTKIDFVEFSGFSIDANDLASTRCSHLPSDLAPKNVMHGIVATNAGHDRPTSANGGTDIL